MKLTALLKSFNSTKLYICWVSFKISCPFAFEVVKRGSKLHCGPLKVVKFYGQKPIFGNALSISFAVEVPFIYVTF